MNRSTPMARRLWLALAGSLLLAGLTACHKKTDPAATTATGGASTKRNVLTLKGAMQ